MKSTLKRMPGQKVFITFVTALLLALVAPHHAAADVTGPLRLGSGQASTWLMTGMGFLPGGTFSLAHGVSADGSVVVGYNDTVVMGASGMSSSEEAFRWTRSGGMVGLGFLSGDKHSHAHGVSADGSVVVGYSTVSPSGVQAFRWTQAGGMVCLCNLPSRKMSKAHGVSADGTVVVGYSFDNGQEAFRWTQSGGMAAPPKKSTSADAP